MSQVYQVIDDDDWKWSFIILFTVIYNNNWVWLYYISYEIHQRIFIFVSVTTLGLVIQVKINYQCVTVMWRAKHVMAVKRMQKRFRLLVGLVLVWLHSLASFVCLLCFWSHTTHQFLLLPYGLIHAVTYLSIYYRR